MRISTLKRRAEFQRVRGGGRWSTASFVLEGKARTDPRSVHDGPRFGFTVTKKLGGAVVRNRIRRRLKAAIAGLAPTLADARFDYVVIAREVAHEQSFDVLCAELATAFRKVNAGTGSGRSGERRPTGTSKRSPAK